MTWKEFKDYVEREGVDDDTYIECINVSFYLADMLPPKVEITPDSETEHGYSPERVRITDNYAQPLVSN